MSFCSQHGPGCLPIADDSGTALLHTNTQRIYKYDPSSDPVRVVHDIFFSTFTEETFLTHQLTMFNLACQALGKDRPDASVMQLMKDRRKLIRAQRAALNNWCQKHPLPKEKVRIFNEAIEQRISLFREELNRLETLHDTLSSAPLEQVSDSDPLSETLDHVRNDQGDRPSSSHA